MVNICATTTLIVYINSNNCAALIQFKKKKKKKACRVTQTAFDDVTPSTFCCVASL